MDDVGGKCWSVGETERQRQREYVCREVCGCPYSHGTKDESDS